MPNGPAEQMLLTESLPWLRLTPPVVAIVLAVLVREVNIALIVAVLAGCALTADLQPAAVLDEFCDVVVDRMASADNASVILFTVLLGAMIGLMNDSGGTQAVIHRLAAKATSRHHGQVLTWLTGLVVFFDDYANTMLIGSSMRPLCDRLRISRAKLAFLIDATAAPVAGLALSTWTAFEVDQVAKGLQHVADAPSAMEVFVRSIPYRIYPIVAIVMVGAVAFSGRDFGPMLKAEIRTSGETTTRPRQQSDDGSLWFAVLPIMMLVGVFLTGMIREGLQLDAYRWLLYASVLACLVAFLVPVAMRRLTVQQAADSWVSGICSMIPAIVVLILAWSVGSVCGDDRLGTADYIISLVGRSVSPSLLPGIAFLAAGAIAVAIGSSFTTMALMMPVFLPLTWNILSAAELAELNTSHPVFLAVVGAILAGAIFGDHCSPISDTTVLSSAAAGCDHLQHVATQLPYALLIAGCSLVFGYLPIGFGVPWWLALPASMVICVAVLVFLGRRPDDLHDT